MELQADKEWKLAGERRRIAEREEEERAEVEFKDLKPIKPLKSRYYLTEKVLDRFFEERKRQEKDQKKTKIIATPVHRKHLLPDTLEAYQLPWAWDEEDGKYIIIKTWFSEEVQEELFAHSRRLRESRLKTYTAAELVNEHPPGSSPHSVSDGKRKLARLNSSNSGIFY
ncbi:hypothetical protein BDW69DRAFT_187703 [Aspergillus filifer]